MPDFSLWPLSGARRTRANQKKWGIFKCPFRGILLRHQHMTVCRSCVGQNRPQSHRLCPRTIENSQKIRVNVTWVCREDAGWSDLRILS